MAAIETVSRICYLGRFGIKRIVLTSRSTQAAPVIRTIKIKALSRQSRGVDPILLARKLEAVIREQEAANTRRERRQATRNGTYISTKSATQSSDSSSTPPLSQFDVMKSPATNLPTRDSLSTARQTSRSTADGRPVMTHKSMFAALNLGLADLEAMTEKLALEQSKQRDFLCSSCRTPDAPGHHHHHNDPESRNYSRHRPIATASHLVAAKRSSQIAYERVEPATDASPQYHAISYRASEDNPRTFNQRPQLQRHDRPDWSQQSQYGGDTSTRTNLFDVPSGYIFRRRSQQPATASEAVPARKAHINMPPPPPPKEMHLISDAVKLIKAQERKSRRKSVVDFLKKF